MSPNLFRYLPIPGILVAFALLAISSYQYAGDVHWSRVTVSLLCAEALPNGDANHVRAPSIVALLLLCGAMALLFQLISDYADTRGQQKTIQIAGIGSMVYALLTATPMHNLMVNIALAFFLTAIIALAYMLFRKRHYVLASIGIGCIVMKLTSVSLYYTNTWVDAWGLIQKASFLVTTCWLVAVHLRLQKEEPGSRHNKLDSMEPPAAPESEVQAAHLEKVTTIL